MLRIFRSFLSETDGAVTVDWVVITAGVVGMAIFILSPYGIGPVTIAESVNDSLGSVTDQFFSEDFFKTD